VRVRPVAVNCRRRISRRRRGLRRRWRRRRVRRHWLRVRRALRNCWYGDRWALRGGGGLPLLGGEHGVLGVVPVLLGLADELLGLSDELLGLVLQRPTLLRGERCLLLLKPGGLRFFRF